MAFWWGCVWRGGVIAGLMWAVLHFIIDQAEKTNQVVERNQAMRRTVHQRCADVPGRDYPGCYERELRSLRYEER